MSAERDPRRAVIFIDDEEEVRLSGAQTLELEGFAVSALAGAGEALAIVSRDWPGVVVSDIKMPGLDGMALLERVCEIDPELPVVLITGHGDIALAVEAMRRGAYDFIEKPADPERLIEAVRRALDKRRLVLDNRALRGALEATPALERRILGKSAAMERLRRTVGDLADTDVDVLVVGETGTGKELVARCLHELGSRREGRFVALNCGALPEGLVESELLGHEAGAFTGAGRRRIGKIEHADRGTLFLDEIESMPLAAQVKLLRVLQERTLERLGGNQPVAVDIRVIAAAKSDLREACRAGSFREDLYYRLGVAVIALPALRERREDIALLFAHFAEAAARRYHRPLPALGERLTAWLLEQPWPGNVRELRNCAERWVLGLALDGAPEGVGESEGTPGLDERLARFERETIAEALRRHRGRIGATAAALAIPRKKLYLRMRKHGLRAEQFR